LKGIYSKLKYVYTKIKYKTSQLVHNRISFKKYIEIEIKGEGRKKLEKHGRKKRIEKKIPLFKNIF